MIKETVNKVGRMEPALISFPEQKLYRTPFRIFRHSIKREIKSLGSKTRYMESSEYLILNFELIDISDLQSHQTRTFIPIEPEVLSEKE